MLRTIFGRLHLSWIVDSLIHLIIAAASLVILIWAIIISISDFGYLSAILTIFGGISFYYSAIKSIYTTMEDRRQLSMFEAGAETMFAQCRKSVLALYPSADKVIHNSQQRVLATYFNDWKRHGEIEPFEYQIVGSYLNHLAKGQQLDEGEKLFLKYRLMTSDFTRHFSTFVKENENGDYYTNTTVHNRFIKRVYVFSNKVSKIMDLDILELDELTIRDTICYALKKVDPALEALVKEKKAKERLHFLLNRVYENGYSNIGDLDKNLADDSKHTLTLFFKYDERFTGFKYRWEAAIKKHLAKTITNKQDLERESGVQLAVLKKLVTGQPVWRAMTKDYGSCFEQVGMDNKLFVVYLEYFGKHGAAGWTIERFMNQKVIPRAKEHLNQLNLNLVKEFPFLKDLQKTTINANYYIFKVGRKSFEHHAEYESMPEPIKRFIVREIMESESAADHLASQLIYIKQVIDDISISGLLFTESRKVQEDIRSIEGEILKKSKKAGLSLGSTQDIATMGNGLDIFIQVMYESFFKKPMKSKRGKKYNEIGALCRKIVNNAKELLQMFNTMKTSTGEE